MARSAIIIVRQPPRSFAVELVSFSSIHAIMEESVLKLCTDLRASTTNIYMLGCVGCTIQYHGSRSRHTKGEIHNEPVALFNLVSACARFLPEESPKTTISKGEKPTTLTRQMKPATASMNTAGDGLATAKASLTTNGIRWQKRSAWR